MLNKICQIFPSFIFMFSSKKRIVRLKSYCFYASLKAQQGLYRAMQYEPRSATPREPHGKKQPTLRSPPRASRSPSSASQCPLREPSFGRPAGPATTQNQSSNDPIFLRKVHRLFACPMFKKMTILGILMQCAQPR